jgi:toxin FitB
VTYLLETSILSETRKRQPASGVTRWIAATPPERLHVSALTLGDGSSTRSRFLS